MSRPLLVGAGLFAFGIAVMVDRTVATLLPIGWLVATLGGNYFVAGTGGLVALLTGLGLLARRAAVGDDRAAPPQPETVPTGRRPGATVDEVLAADGLLSGYVRAHRRRQVRDRLRQAAIGTITRTDGCPRTVARDRVATGEWTDDRAAASLLAADRTAEPLTQRLREALGGNSRFRRRVRRAATEIVERARGGSDR